MSTTKPLTEGNMRSNKKAMSLHNLQPNMKPKAPPPSPQPNYDNRNGSGIFGGVLFKGIIKQ